jgi:hypothetical protein
MNENIEVHSELEIYYYIIDNDYKDLNKNNDGLMYTYKKKIRDIFVLKLKIINADDLFK